MKDPAKGKREAGLRLPVELRLERYGEMRRLYFEEQLTHAVIGRRFQLSRARVSKIINGSPPGLIGRRPEGRIATEDD